MSAGLLALFIATLVFVGILALAEARHERLERSGGNGRGAKDSWAEVARILDLEMGPFTEGERSLRGSVNDHWISIYHDQDGTHIEVSYQSGVGQFEVAQSRPTKATNPKGSSKGSLRALETGDDAFDGELSILTRSQRDMDDYLSPARRNALLWLHSGFDIEELTNEKLSVRVKKNPWKPQELVSDIQLVVDVADIMQAGEKVFMSPPIRGEAGEAITEDGESPNTEAQPDGANPGNSPLRSV